MFSFLCFDFTFSVYGICEKVITSLLQKHLKLDLFQHWTCSNILASVTRDNIAFSDIFYVNTESVSGGAASHGPPPVFYLKMTKELIFNYREE